MFSRLRRWCTRPRLAIFQTRLRDGIRHYDPAIIRRRLNEACPEWAALVDQVTAAAKPLRGNLDLPELHGKRAESTDACVGELAKAVALAFEMPPLKSDGSGYSEAERLTVLGEFLAFCAGLLEETRSFQPSLRATV